MELSVDVEKIELEYKFDGSKRKSFPAIIKTKQGFTLSYVGGSRLSDQIRSQYQGYQYPKSYVYLDQDGNPYESLFMLTPDNQFTINKLISN